MPLRRLTGPTRLGVGVAAAVLALAACGRIPTGDPLAAAPSSAGTSTPSTAESEGSSVSPDPADTESSTEACEYVTSGEPARPVKPPPATGVPTSGIARYALRMSEGTVTITLDRTRAPCTAHSFESLAQQKFFDRTRCHRLLDFGAFLLHCGDPTATGEGGPGYTFADETDGSETYTAGVVAMANAGPNTNGSQFFLIYDDSTSLDATPQFTIFGTLDETSRGIVARMGAEGQDGSQPDGSGRPNNPAQIVSVTKVE